jgi:hypothetical protein
LGSSTAAEFPTSGLLYNTKEASSLRFECRKDGDRLSCDFVQVSIRRKVDPTTLADALAKARDEFSKANKDEFRVGECSKWAEVAKALKTGETPKGVDDAKAFMDEMRTMTVVEKRDLIEMMNLFGQLCKTPSVDNYLAFAKHQFDRDSRTCLVSSNSYHQEFKRVEQSMVWVVVQDAPLGECGVVNVNRFEAEKSKYSNTFDWKYFAKKIVTNKSGQVFLGLSCSSLDEGEYLYDWRSRDRQLGCDYISLSGF